MALNSNSLQKENFCDFQFTLEIGLRHVLPEVKLNILNAIHYIYYGTPPTLMRGELVAYLFVARQTTVVKLLCRTF
jgi:hypothetical protein